MPKQKRYITKLEYAEHRGVKPAYISKLLRQGKIKTTKSGRIDWKVYDAILDQRANSIAPDIDDKPKSKVSRSNEDYWEARKRKENLLADKAELELNIKRGLYVKIELVNNALMVKGLAVRQAIEAIADRISGRLVGKDVLQIMEILKAEHDAALFELTKELEIDE